MHEGMIDTVIHADCLTALRAMPDNSVDAICTDPPAGIEFMGKEWDSFKQGRLKDYDTQPGGKIKSNPGEGADFGARMSSMPNVGNQRANRRCLKCNHYQFSGTPCKCAMPEWAKDTSTRDTFISFLREVMTEALRVLKPGGHALVWSLPRTSHWTAMALEDAGFEIRDCVYHIFGSGFPKSTAIDKAIERSKTLGNSQTVQRIRTWITSRRNELGLTNRDLDQATSSDMASHWTTHPTQPSIPTSEQWAKLEPLLGKMPEWMEPYIKPAFAPSDAWYEREVIRTDKHGTKAIWGIANETNDITAPATPEARQWAGYGTALKPSVENWILCRKPLSENSIAANVLKWHTGAINIDSCRVGAENEPIEWCECEEGDDDL